MPTLELSEEQVIELVKQLPLDKKEELFKILLTQQWGTWIELSLYGEQRVRMAAARRGCDWDAMTEDEQETFIDDVVHEDS